MTATRFRRSPPVCRAMPTNGRPSMPPPKTPSAPSSVWGSLHCAEPSPMNARPCRPGILPKARLPGGALNSNWREWPVGVMLQTGHKGCNGTTSSRGWAKWFQWALQDAVGTLPSAPGSVGIHLASYGRPLPCLKRDRKRGDDGPNTLFEHRIGGGVVGCSFRAFRRSSAWRELSCQAGLRTKQLSAMRRGGQLLVRLRRLRRP